MSGTTASKTDDKVPRRVRAAQYVRISTEHQKYSTENQTDAIAQYAERRGFEIVRTYEDSGKSGLRLDGRLSLQQLISDGRSGDTPSSQGGVGSRRAQELSTRSGRLDPRTTGRD